MVNTNLIGISGKIGSGKDLIASIIQYLTSSYYKSNYSFEYFLLEKSKRNDYPSYLKWKIKKFADAPKEIVCILLGCNRKQLESQEFKNSDLPEYLCRYNVYKTSKSKMPFRANISHDELQWLHNIDKWEIKKTVKTVRDLLIYLANDVFRDTIGQNIWINTLFNQYRTSCNFDKNLPKNTNWIITDVRYQNEAEYIKNKGGILIRTNRWVDELIPKEKIAEMLPNKEIYGIYFDGTESLIDENSNLSDFSHFVTEKKHINSISEIDLDDYTKFDFVIENNGFDINLLIKEVESILKTLGLI